MRAILLRRVMVLGVCALGVGALYLVPGLGASSGQYGVPAPASEVPGTRPTSAPGPDSASVAARSADDPETAPTARPRTKPSSTPFEATTQDTDPPGAVTELTVRSADPTQVRLAWAPSPSGSGVVAYKVWLNGYEVRSTSETEVTLDWFHDDSTMQVVVVRAVDAAGNQSRTAATLLLTRPAPTITSVT